MCQELEFYYHMFVLQKCRNNSQSNIKLWTNLWNVNHVTTLSEIISELKSMEQESSEHKFMEKRGTCTLNDSLGIPKYVNGKTRHR
jgi:hypothetical protein